jgi:AcrR family transcriptional regulator
LVESGDAEAVSIRAIARECGCTPPAIYMHWSDKNALLDDACQLQFEALDRCVAEAAEGVDDPVEVMRRQAHAYVRFGLENPEHYRLLFMHGDLVRREPEELLRLSCFGRVLRTVEQATEAGRLRHDDPLLLTIALWSAVHGITSLLIAKPDFPWPPLDDVVNQVIDVAIAGALKPS